MGMDMYYKCLNVDIDECNVDEKEDWFKAMLSMEQCFFHSILGCICNNCSHLHTPATRL